MNGVFPERCGSGGSLYTLGSDGEPRAKRASANKWLLRSNLTGATWWLLSLHPLHSFFTLLADVFSYFLSGLNLYLRLILEVRVQQRGRMQYTQLCVAKRKMEKHFLWQPENGKERNEWVWDENEITLWRWAPTLILLWPLLSSNDCSNWTAKSVPFGLIMVAVKVLRLKQSATECTATISRMGWEGSMLLRHFPEYH